MMMLTLFGATDVLAALIAGRASEQQLAQFVADEEYAQYDKGFHGL